MITFKTKKKGNRKIAQLGDAHLSITKFSDFNKVDYKTGYTYLQKDFLGALSEAVDVVIEEDVAVVIFPGDIYDHVANVPERVLDGFQNQLLKLVENGVAVVLICGNHDKPKSINYKALISRYCGIGKYLNVAAVYEDKYETININDEILIHALPYIHDKVVYRKQFDLIKPDDSFPVNVLTTHIAVKGAGIKAYEYAYEGDSVEAKEAWIDKAELAGFDFIALGDYHDLYKVSDRAYYAGAVCRNSFGEKDCKHGVIVYDGNTDKFKILDYNTRNMFEYSFDCMEFTPDEVNTKLKEIHDNLDKEAYIKISFKNITKTFQSQLDSKNIANIKKKSYYCKTSYDILNEETGEITESEIMSIKEEVFYSIEHMDIGKDMKEEIKKLYEAKCLNV